jgi:hypothetical protein
MSCEISFDMTPATRKVGISGRQGEDRVQMVRQDNDGINGEWTFLPGAAKCRAQCPNSIDEN